jgi:hypothetical protein
VGTGSAKPEIRVKAMEAVKSLECSRQGLLAYGARNPQKVTAGTGEAPLPGPGSLRRLLSERRAP